MPNDTAVADRIAAFSQKPWTKVTVEDLGQAALVPTMLKPDEQQYYFWLTRDWATGTGAVVDLGSFAGGSTACLAEGIARAGRDQLVFGYDKFVVEDYSVFRQRYDDYCKSYPANESPHTPRPLPPLEGTDLTPIALFFLEFWRDRVTLKPGQIEDIGWNAGDIEVLVMDASKTAETMDQMSRQFFPHLVPGKSIVVQQDFLWWQQPWIAVQMEILADYFEPVAYVPRDSVSFLYKKAIPSDVLEGLSVAGLSDKDFISNLRAMKQRLKGFPVDAAMRRLLASVRANPTERKAFRFKNKP